MTSFFHKPHVARTLIGYFILAFMFSLLSDAHIHLAETHGASGSHRHDVEVHIAHDSSHHDAIDRADVHASDTSIVTLDVTAHTQGITHQADLLTFIWVMLFIVVVLWRTLAPILEPNVRLFPVFRYSRLQARAPPR
jgi:hypothetical protein